MRLTRERDLEFETAKDVVAVVLFVLLLPLILVLAGLGGSRPIERLWRRR